MKKVKFREISTQVILRTQTRSLRFHISDFSLYPIDLRKRRGELGNPLRSQFQSTNEGGKSCDFQMESSVTIINRCNLGNRDARQVSGDTNQNSYSFP